MSCSNSPRRIPEPTARPRRPIRSSITPWQATESNPRGGRAEFPVQSIFPAELRIGWREFGELWYDMRRRGFDL